MTDRHILAPLSFDVNYYFTGIKYSPHEATYLNIHPAVFMEFHAVILAISTLEFVFFSLNPYLSTNSGNLPLFHDCFCYNVGEWPPGQVFHDYPEVALDHVALDVVHQVGMPKFFHYLQERIIS